MALSFLKKASAYKPEQSIKYLLHKNMSGYEDARPLSRIHASALTKEEGFCPRFYALSDVTKAKPKDEYLTTSETVTFHIGRVLQDLVVNKFADLGKAICHWKCVACKHTHEFQTRPIKCQVCGVRVFQPVEVRFESAITGASCGVDMLLGLGEAKLRAVELKTMDKDQFKTLLAPLAEHRLRTNLYLRIIEESASPWAKLVGSQIATVLYISKGGYGCADPELKTWGLTEGFSPFKEYTVTRSDAETDEVCRRSKAVKDFREGKAGMPCGICTTALGKRAAYCERKTVCFSGDHPPVNMWSKS